MKLLVTGVAGFIGSNFIEYILRKYKDYFIVGLDALTYSGFIENITKIDRDLLTRFKFIHGNINNADLINYILKEFNIDGIVNFAAESHVDNSINSPMIFFDTNIIGLANLLETAKNYWYKDGVWEKNKLFLQISTDEVYGSLDETGLFEETTPLDPHSPYSSSKASADMIVKSYYDTYKMPIFISRCSNNYGPKQHPEKLIPKIIQNAIAHKKIPIYGNGKQVRDWIHVDDHCAAIDAILHSSLFGEVFNIGANNEIQNIVLTKLIINQISNMNNDPDTNENLISYVKDRQGHDERYGINSNKMKELLNWEARISFEEGIKSTIDWYLSNSA